MKKLLLLSMMIIVCQLLFAQSRKIDSLNNLITKSTSDTQRINLGAKKISELVDINLDSSISYGNKIINEAQKIKYKKGETLARVNVIYAYCYKGEFSLAKQYLDLVNSDPDQINDPLIASKYYTMYGLFYSMENKTDSSLPYYLKAIKFAEASKDQRQLCVVFENTAIAYQQVSNYPLALEYYQKGLAIAEQQNDKQNEAFIQVNMAITFTITGDTARAVQYYLKAIPLAKELDLKNVEAYAYANLSSTYGNQKKRKDQYDYAMKAAELAKQIGDMGIQSSSLARAGEALAWMHNVSDAENLIKQGMRIADSSHQPINIYQTYAQMGDVLTMQEKCNEAIPVYEKALQQLSDGDIYDAAIAESYIALSHCYEQNGGFEKALTAFKKSKSISDSLTNKENIRKSTELAMNYDFDKKKQAIKIEQQKKDEITKTKQTALIIGLVLTLLLAGVALNGYRNKQKANHLLKKQKKEIEEQRDQINKTLSELKSAQQQLIQSEKMASLGELTAGIAHEIQNPLNFVNNFSEVNQEMVEEATEEINKGNIEEVKFILNDIKENSEKINHHGKRADAIVKGMLQHSRQTSGTKESTDINALCDEYLRLSYHGLRAKDKNFNADFKTDFDESIGKINIVPQDVGRVLLNLFNNAFYATNEKKKTESLKQNSEYKPLVSISTKKIKDAIEIIVVDNGSGIPQSIINKIFQPFFTTKPTGEGTGLGLSLSYDIIKAHGGELKVDTQKNEGSSFIIKLYT